MEANESSFTYRSDLSVKSYSYFQSVTEKAELFTVKTTDVS